MTNPKLKKKKQEFQRALAVSINRMDIAEVDRLLQAFPKALHLHDSTGFSLMDLAINAGSLEIIDLLMSRGFRINTTDVNAGMNAVQFAARESSIEIFKELLKYQPDLFATSRHSRLKKSTLHYAVDNHDVSHAIEISKILIAKGLDINHISGEHYTPLMMAVLRGNDRLDLIKFLVEHGASLAIPPIMAGEGDKTIADLADPGSQVESYLTAVMKLESERHELEGCLKENVGSNVESSDQTKSPDHTVEVVGLHDDTEPTKRGKLHSPTNLRKKSI